MSTTYEKISSNKAKLSFVVPAEEFDAAMNKAYLKERGKITIPGFRKGKAPRVVIERMYGEAVFYDDALDILFPDAYQAAVKEHDLHPVDRPECNVDEIGAGKDLKFTVEVFVRPDVTLGQYKGLTVEVAPKAEVTEEDVDARIAQAQQQGARQEEVTDQPVDYTDTVNLDYAGSVDGVPFEGGTAQGQTLKIGSHQFIPGFEEQMVGMTVGEEKDLKVKFPEEYHAKNLQGKDAVFHVKVNSITKTQLPELDDDFAQDNGFDTMDAFKADARRQLEEEAEASYQVRVENALVDAASKNATMDIPKAMIDDQADYMVRQMEIRMMYQGLRMEDYLKYTGQTREQLVETYHAEAEERVRVELTLEAIRKEEGLEPDEDEVAAQIAKEATRANQELEDFKANMSETQHGYMVDAAAIQKVCDLLTSTATVVEPKPEAAAEQTETDQAE